MPLRIDIWSTFFNSFFISWWLNIKRHSNLFGIIFNYIYAMQIHHCVYSDSNALYIKKIVRKYNN